MKILLLSEEELMREREKMRNVITSVSSTFTWELWRTWFYPEHWESSVWRLCRLDLLLCRCKGRCCLPALSPAAEPALRWCTSAEEWTRGAGCPLATWYWGEVSPQHYRGGLRGNPVPLTPLRSHSPPWSWGELEKKQDNTVMCHLTEVHDALQQWSITAHVWWKTFWVLNVFSKSWWCLDINALKLVIILHY